MTATPPAAPAPGPLLTTKLRPAVRRRSTVERPRLDERVHAELPALVLVSAPAGFGKTTLLAGWAARRATEGRPCAWVSLDAGDDDPGRFWTYVLAAVEHALPGVGLEAQALHRAGQPAAVVSAALVDDLHRSPDELVVLLDDYHSVEAPEVHEEVGALLDRLPPHVHVVIATRVDPPLPLARLRAQGELLEVRAADLRFTEDEAAAYLNTAMDLALTSDEIGALEARTEGWAAALQLAALSMRDRPDRSAFIADFAGDDRHVVDYLAEEVLERQPEPIRRFLLETSILERLTGPLCDAVTGGSGGRARLEQLDRANLFLVALDDRRRWYRYHHLFADVLRARLLDEAAERFDELHRRASAWYESEGDLSSAVTHALAGHDVEGAARLVELAAPSLFQTRQEHTTRRWLSALPPELFRTRPVLAIEMVGALMVSGEVAGVDDLLDDVERWLDPHADTSDAVVFDRETFARLPAQVAVYRAALALIAGDLDATVEHAHRVLDLTEPGDHLQRGSACALIGLARWTAGELAEATDRYTEAVDELTAAGHISDVLGCTIARSDLLTVQGRLDDAGRALEGALDLARRHGVVRGRADMHVGLAEVLLERGDLEAAARQLEDAADLGEGAGLPQNPYRSLVVAARLRAAAGRWDEALHLLEGAQRRFDTDMSPPVRPVAAIAARVHLGAGDVRRARRWAGEAKVAVDDELRYLREYEHVTLARLLLAEGDTDAAVELIERLRAAAEEGGRATTVIELLVLLAVAREREGERAAAEQALHDALVRAEPEGHLQVVADELPALEPLLRAAARSGPGSDLARRARRATPPPGASGSTAGDQLIDPLSARELEVLRLLKGELSGPDIARELHVSLNTLRTHTKSIFAKLGATSRREAVRRAAELGL